MSKISVNEIEKGIFIEFKGEISQVIEFQHINPGKGSAFVRTRLKNIKNGKVLEFTYKSGETVEKVPVNVKDMQYLYRDGENFMFMDKDSYEQVSLDEVVIGGFASYLKEGEAYPLLIHDEQAVGMRFPKKVRLLVAEAEDAVRGDTSTNARKKVTLETGVVVNAPQFIKKGDLIAVDPENGEYVERISQ